MCGPAEFQLLNRSLEMNFKRSVESWRKRRLHLRLLTQQAGYKPDLMNKKQTKGEARGPGGSGYIAVSHRQIVSAFKPH